MYFALLGGLFALKPLGFRSIIANYDALGMLLEESLSFVKETDMKSRIQGVLSCMQTFDYFFGVSLGELVLKHSDNLSKTLQSTAMSAAEGQKIAAMTVGTLQSIRSDDKFELFWEVVSKSATGLDVEEPKLPIHRKRPRRYDRGSSDGDIPHTVQDHYRRIYFEALDLVISGIKSHFDQPGFFYSNLEELLVKAAKKCPYDDELKFVTDFYKDDFSREELKMHLDIMATDLPADTEADLHSILHCRRELSEPQRILLSQVCKVVSLIVVMSATNAVSERSFSCLRC